MKIGATGVLGSEARNLRRSLLGATLISVALLGAGCSSLQPTLQDITIDNGVTSPAEKSAALLDGAANNMLRQYKGHYNESANISDLSALPILGAAAVAAGLLLYDAGSGYLKGVALGAGTYSAFRFFLVPDDLPEIYLRGQSAVTCVLGAGEPLRQTAAGLDIAAINLVGKIGKAEALILRIDVMLANGEYEVGGSISETSRAIIQANKTSLQSELQNARTMRSQAEAAKGAYEAGPRTIANALESIQRKVVEKVRDGRSVSFADAVTAISSAYEGLTQQELVQMVEETPPADFIRSQTDAVGRLHQMVFGVLSARLNLESNIPDYVGAQERVGTCPNQV